MKNTLIAFTFTIAISAISAQSAGNYVYQKLQGTPITTGQPTGKKTHSLNSRTLTIQSNILMNVVPDAQIAVFTVVQLGETAQEATELMDSKIAPIKSGLNSIGITNKDIVIDMVSFIPRYEDTIIKKRFSKTFTEIPKGFELKKNIHVKFKNHELIDKIIAICAENEVYDLAKVEYIVLENETHKKTMRDKILLHIGEQIAFYHQLEVQDDIEIHNIYEQSDEFYPLDRYQQYTAFSSSSFEAIEKSKKKNIRHVTKNSSLFYDPLSTKNFDMVLNPGILTPTVQYTLDITVNYTLPLREEKEPVVKEKIVEKKEFILITPNGETRVLKL